MMQYRNSTQVIDGFFKNPYKVMDLGNSLDFVRDETWPGTRTENLLTSSDPQVLEFAKFFAKMIADNVFYGLKKFKIDIRFHKNDIYDISEANEGWIHNDEIDFAGLVYLNPEIPNMNTGTSIFEKISEGVFEVKDYNSRKVLNSTQQVTQEYLEDLKANRENFLETINVGNKFNRLVAYDAEQWHRPNNYVVEIPPRYSLLFFINEAEFEEQNSLLSMTSNWSDKYDDN